MCVCGEKNFFFFKKRKKKTHFYLYRYETSCAKRRRMGVVFNLVADHAKRNQCRACETHIYRHHAHMGKLDTIVAVPALHARTR